VVCDSALLLGYSRQLHVIGDDIIREAAVELRLVPAQSERTAPAPSRSADPKPARFLKRFRLFH